MEVTWDWNLIIFYLVTMRYPYLLEYEGCSAKEIKGRMSNGSEGLFMLGGCEYV